MAEPASATPGRLATDPSAEVAKAMSTADPYAFGGKFVPIFAWLLRVPGVTLTDAYLYGLLASYRGAGASGECRVSVTRLAGDLGADCRDTRRRLQKLERLGLIERERRPGRANVIRFLPAWGGARSPGVAAPGVGVPGVLRPVDPGADAPGGGGVCAPVDPGVQTPARVDLGSRSKRVDPESRERASARPVPVPASGPEPRLERGAGAPDADDPYASLERQRAVRLIKIFERVVHKGHCLGAYDEPRKALMQLLPALDQRCPNDPEGLFERVLVAYDTDQRRRGKTPRPKYFCADFAEWFDRVTSGRGAQREGSGGAAPVSGDYDETPILEAVHG